MLVGDGTPVAGSLRARGIPIGGVVRAEARPAVRVGLPEPGSGLPGRTPFALTLEAWRGLGRGSQRFEVDGLELLLTPAVVGRRIGGSAGLRAGHRLGTGGELEPLSRPDSHLAYVPLVEDLTEDGIVVGFGYAEVESADETELVLRRLEARVAPGNASASPLFLAGAVDVAAVLEAREEAVLLRAAVPR